MANGTMSSSRVASEPDNYAIFIYLRFLSGGIHFNPAIGDVEQDVIADMNGIRIATDKILVHVEVGSGKSQIAAMRHGVTRVDYKVENHLLYLAFIGFDACQCGLQARFKLDVFT